MTGDNAVRYDPDMFRLFLDDERFPPDDGRDDWIICRTVKHAQDLLITGRVRFCTFDHDLGDNLPTGMDLAKWMVEKDVDSGGRFLPPDFTFDVHSQNPVGATNIRGLLDNWFKVKETLV